VKVQQYFNREKIAGSHNDA